MLDEDMYNRICNLFFVEGVRLENKVVEKQNFIVKYRPSEAHPYIELIKAQAELDYFNNYVFSLLKWFDRFVE